MGTTHHAEIAVSPPRWLTLLFVRRRFVLYLLLLLLALGVTRFDRAGRERIAPIPSPPITTPSR